MRYRLTEHAEHVLAEREIPLAWVERVLDFPERAEPDREQPELEHRLGRISEHGNRVLRVILNTMKTPVEVVTVYFDRAMRSRL